MMRSESPGHLLNNKMGHRIDGMHACLDKWKMEAQCLHLPQEIVWIYRNAVPADSRTWVERHESEGLCGCSIDDLPDIHAELIRDARELGSGSDVDSAKRIFKQLDQFGTRRRIHYDDFFANVTVKGRR